MKRILAALFFCLAATAYAQTDVVVSVTPDHADWTYTRCEKTEFTVSVLDGQTPLAEGTVHYELSEDMAEPFRKGKLKLKKGKACIKVKGLETSGFIRCRAWTESEGKTYSGVATAAYAPEGILPEITAPEDFDEFWADALAKAAEVPLESTIETWPEQSTDKCDAYKVSFQNDCKDSRIYAVLFMPKDARGKKLPAIISYPGAGIHPRFFAHFKRWAEEGYILLSIQIHGIPNVDSYEIRDNLWNGPLRNYWEINLHDKNKYYYKRVYTGCIRAIDFLETLPEYDGRVIAEGSSQGGALAIVTTALDKRIKACLTMHPALCNMTHRAACWPAMFRDPKMRIPLLMENFRYFDTTCFASRITVPVYMTFGFNDTTCPPTGSYSAYNVMTAPKTLEIHPTSDHVLWITEMWDFFDKAIHETLPLD